MNIYDYADKNKMSIRQVIDFSNCTNPLGVSVRVKNALRKEIKNIHISPDRESRYLSKIIAKKENITYKNFVFGEGSKCLLRAIFHGAGTKTCLVPAPVSHKYKEIAHQDGIFLKDIPPRRGNPFSSSIDALLTGMKDADTVLLPYPHDMLGTAPTKEELSGFISQTHKRNITLIIDESLREYTELPSPVQEVISSDKAVIVRSFSYFFSLAGLPLGYAIGSARTIESIRNFLYPATPNTLALHAAISSLRDSLYAPRTKQLVDMEKLFFLKTLDAMKEVTYINTDCPFLLLKIDADTDDTFQSVFTRYRILIDDFVEVDGDLYLRVPVKKHKWNARFLKTLRNVLGSKT